jgi:hypothetical protein
MPLLRPTSLWPSTTCVLFHLFIKLFSSCSTAGNTVQVLRGPSNAMSSPQAKQLLFGNVSISQQISLLLTLRVFLSVRPIQETRLTTIEYESTFMKEEHFYKMPTLASLSSSPTRPDVIPIKPCTKADWIGSWKSAVSSQLRAMGRLETLVRTSRLK